MARRLGRIILVILLGLAIAGAVIWRMSWMTPAWYAPPEEDDAAADAIAQDVEYFVLEQAHKVRPEEDVWQVVFDETEINAWLATRLSDWAAHQADAEWTERIDRPQLHLHDGGVSIAAAVKEDDSVRILRARFTPRIEDSRLFIVVERFGLGRVRVPGAPAAALLDRLDDVIPADADIRRTLDSAAKFLAGEFAIDPVFELEDGRQVRLEQIQVEDGRVQLTCRTLPGRR